MDSDDSEWDIQTDEDVAIDAPPSAAAYAHPAPLVGAVPPPPYNIADVPDLFRDVHDSTVIAKALGRGGFNVLCEVPAWRIFFAVDQIAMIRDPWGHCLSCDCKCPEHAVRELKKTALRPLGVTSVSCCRLKLEWDYRVPTDLERVESLCFKWAIAGKGMSGPEHKCLAKTMADEWHAHLNFR